VHLCDGPERGADYALRVIFVGVRIPEISEQTIAEILCDAAIEPPDDFSAGCVYPLKWFASCPR
jgi:hypothetical protein